MHDRDVPALLGQLAGYGLSTRSACGHTVRNVMASEDAGVGLDEPFDCLPDARMISDALIGAVGRAQRHACRAGSTSPSAARRAAVTTPSSTTSASCRWSSDGVAGYEMWAGGSLGKAPQLAVLLAPFVARTDVLAAVEAVVDVFVSHGAFDEPAKARLKFLVEQLGADGFRAAWQAAFEAARTRPHPAVAAIELVDDVDQAEILAESPPGGWRAGVRPQRRPGQASVTIDVPLGDITSFEMELFCDLADRHGDGFLTFTRDQNVTLRNVPLAGVGDDPHAPSASAACSCSARVATPRSGRAPARRCARSGITDSPGAGPRPVDPRVAAAQRRAARLRVGLPELVRPAPDRRHRPVRRQGPRQRPDRRRVPGVPRRRPRRSRARRGRRSGRRGRPRPGGRRHRRHVGGAAPPRRDPRPHGPPGRPRRLRQPGHRGAPRPLGAGPEPTSPTTWRPAAAPEPPRIDHPDPFNSTAGGRPCRSPSPPPSTRTPRRPPTRPSPSVGCPATCCRRPSPAPTSASPSSSAVGQRAARRRRVAGRQARAGQRVRHRPHPRRVRRRRAVHRQRHGDAAGVVAGHHVAARRCSPSSSPRWSATSPDRSCSPASCTPAGRRSVRSTTSWRRSSRPRTRPPARSCSGGPCCATPSCAWPSGWRPARSPTPPSSSCCGGRCWRSSPPASSTRSPTPPRSPSPASTARSAGERWSATWRGRCPATSSAAAIVVGLGYAWLGGRKVRVERGRDAGGRRPRLTTATPTSASHRATVRRRGRPRGAGVAAAADGPDPRTERAELAAQPGDRRLGGVLVGAVLDERRLRHHGRRPAHEDRQQPGLAAGQLDLGAVRAAAGPGPASAPRRRRGAAPTPAPRGSRRGRAPSTRAGPAPARRPG